MNFSLSNEEIGDMQFNDTDRRAAGQGEYQFTDVMRALGAMGYKGVIAMEPFRYEPDGAACAAYTLGYVKGPAEALA